MKSNGILTYFFPKKQPTKCLLPFPPHNCLHTIKYTHNALSYLSITLLSFTACFER